MNAVWCILAGVAVAILMLASYFIGYKRLGLCRRIPGEIPKPKLLIRLGGMMQPPTQQVIV